MKCDGVEMCALKLSPISFDLCMQPDECSWFSSCRLNENIDWNCAISCGHRAIECQLFAVRLLFWGRNVNIFVVHAARCIDDRTHGRSRLSQKLNKYHKSRDIHLEMDVRRQENARCSIVCIVFVIATHSIESISRFCSTSASKQMSESIFKAWQILSIGTATTCFHLSQFHFVWCAFKWQHALSASSGSASAQLQSTLYTQSRRL